MKKLLSLLSVFLLIFSLISCGEKEKEPTKNEEKYTTIVENMEDIHIEIGESYTFYYILKKNKGMTFESLDTNIVSTNSHSIIGESVGKTSIILTLEDKKQKLEVEVHEIGALQNSFTFTTERLAKKKVVVFGDSVTYPASIGGAMTYYELFAEHFEMIATCNYAIGGSTGTHPYVGSNIYKEYQNGFLEIDGPSVIHKAYINKELDDIDYAFIHFGHNDQYFIPPVENHLEAEYDVNSFESCKSFKGSYRYMIKTLFLANPSMRIIILGPSYSEYNISNKSPYGITDYSEYRIACMEIANEFGLTFIDLWDPMKPYFDAYDAHFYYNDTVHPSVEGHKKISEFIINYR